MPGRRRKHKASEADGEIGGSVEQAHANTAFRSPGRSARKHRLEELGILAANQYRGENLSEDEIRKRLNAEFPSELIFDSRFERHWDLLSPISTTVPSISVNPLVEAGTVLRLPEISWLRSQLETHESRGRRASRLTASVMFAMALEGISPNVKRVAQEFKMANAARGFLYDYPDLCGRSSLYETLHTAADRRAPDMILHVQMALIRQLAKYVEGPRTNDLTKGGVPRVGEILVVDGTQQQANVRQVVPVNEEHATFLRGPYEMAALVRYLRGNIEIKRNFGFNIVVIADQATSLPLVYAPFPATMDERKATSILLDMLFRLWPDCPARFIVGDSLYDHSESFARELELIWRLHPVFPMHGRRSKTKSPYAATNGVPKCSHGYMTASPEDFLRGDDLAKIGILRGEDPPNGYNPRIRFTCPSEICKAIYLKVRDDPRWHRYIPMAGEHRLRFFGSALMARRNVIESIFALMQMLGFWGPGAGRPRWAKSFREVCWAYMLPLMLLTAKRLAHVKGLYGDLLESTERLGLLTWPTPGQPTPGPDAETLAAERMRLFVPPVAPETWSPVHLNEPLL